MRVFQLILMVCLFPYIAIADGEVPHAQIGQPDTQSNKSVAAESVITSSKKPTNDEQDKPSHKLQKKSVKAPSSSVSQNPKSGAMAPLAAELAAQEGSAATNAMDSKTKAKAKVKAEASAPVISVKPKIKAKMDTGKKSEKDADKCGLFMGFVEEYKVKVKEGCPGAHCPVYKRQLKKYEAKEKRYCKS